MYTYIYIARAQWQIIWVALEMRKSTQKAAVLLGVTQKKQFSIFCVVSLETALFALVELS